MVRYALGANTTSSNSTAVGYNCLLQIQQVDHKSTTALGSSALGTNTTGANNTAVGT